MQQPAPISIVPGSLNLQQLRTIMARPQRVVLKNDCWPAVEAAARLVAEVAAGDAPVYGINTGFGKLASVRIPPDQIEELQRRLIFSHMCGYGAPLSERRSFASPFC